MPIIPPPAHAIDAVLELALAEDLGPSGDLTTALVVPADRAGAGRLISRVSGVLAGGILLAPLFGRLDPAVRVSLLLEDGQPLAPGQTIAELEGPFAALLTGERVALNLVARLSGIATLTRQFVDRASGKAAITDTRKTTPGLRALERYAVRCGGGRNHRFNLADGILIKDNHLAACGSVTEAVHRARAGAPHPIKVEVEVESLEQAREGLAAGADILLLDNMTAARLREVAAELGGRVLLEASGGVQLGNIAEIAASGVDLVSIGALTHSAVSLDLSLELEPVRGG